MFYDQCILIKNKTNLSYYRKIDYICVRFHIELHNQHPPLSFSVALRMGSSVSTRAGEKKQNWSVLQTTRNGRSWTPSHGTSPQLLCSKYISVCFLTFFELFLFIHYKDYCLFILHSNVTESLNVFPDIMLMLCDVTV